MSAPKKVVLSTILTLAQRGTIKNTAATQFLKDACEQVAQADSNNRIINDISENLSKLDHLSEEEANLLKEALSKCPSLASEETTQADENVVIDKTNHSLHGKNFTITDLSNLEQDFQDEYNFILGNKRQTRKYLLELSELAPDGKSNVIFRNFIFGNFSLDFSSTNLGTLFTRSNVISNVLMNYGYISRSGEKCSNSIKQAIFANLTNTNSYASLRRADDSPVAVLKIGDVTVYSNNNIVERHDQYLVCSIDSANHHQIYVCYGNIDFDLLACSEDYNHSVANVLLSVQNLISSRYIGSILGDSIIKSSVLADEHVCTYKLH